MRHRLAAELVQIHHHIWLERDVVSGANKRELLWPRPVSTLVELQLWMVQRGHVPVEVATAARSRFGHFENRAIFVARLGERVVVLHDTELSVSEHASHRDRPVDAASIRNRCRAPTKRLCGNCYEYQRHRVWQGLRLRKSCYLLHCLLQRIRRGECLQVRPVELLEFVAFVCFECEHSELVLGN